MSSFSLESLRAETAQIDAAILANAAGQAPQAQSTGAPQTPPAQAPFPGFAAAAQGAQTGAQHPTLTGGQTAPQPTQSSPREAELAAELEQERQRLRVLQGKYNAEVPRLQAELKELKKAPAPQLSLGLSEDRLDTIDPDVKAALTSFQQSTQEALARQQAEFDALREVEAKRAAEIEESNRLAEFGQALAALDPQAPRAVQDPEFVAWAKRTGRAEGLQLHWGYPADAQLFIDALAIYRNQTGKQTTIPHGTTIPDIATRPGMQTDVPGQVSRTEITAFYERAPRLVATGQMSRADYAKYEAYYDAAMREGRVV